MLPLLIDCTLRDGGYYNSWDFEESIVDAYVKLINALPIDYIELGYRNNPQNEYVGKFGYCPIFELADLRKKCNKKLSVMLNEKDVKPTDLIKLLDPVQGLIDMVRIAVDPQNFERAVLLAENIKTRGFDVGFNVMYMSKWKEYRRLFDKFSSVDGVVDVFYMVDSFGSVFPTEVKEIIKTVKEKIKCSIGFHGHNNLELALSNTLEAIDNDIDYVDATVLGMGRGAGNLKMELLLTYLNRHYNLDVDFNILGDMISIFSDLSQKYKWGTNLPYMISGAFSLPQKEVMEWTNNRLYSFNSIVRALNNKKANLVDNAKYPILEIKKYDSVVIIGGGKNAILHSTGIKNMIEKQASVALIHATARHAAFYQDVNIPQYFCLTGGEGKRLQRVFSELQFNGQCILPPHPRKMGTDVPDFVHDITFELVNIEFTKDNFDSCTAVALQSAVFFCDNDIFLIGYDGYSDGSISEKERTSITENTTLFADFASFYSRKLISLTPSLYKGIQIKSLYQYL